MDKFSKRLDNLTLKKEFLNIFFSLIFLFIFSLAFVSSETLSELLRKIEPSFIILIVVFIIVFSLIYYSLNKFFKKENQTISVIVSLSIAFLVVYSINKIEIVTNMNSTNFLNNTGFSESLTGWIFLIVSIGLIVFIIKKFTIDALWIIGSLLIAISLFVYEQTFLFILGAFMIVSRFFFKKKKKED
jgi:hypothetical protein